jgi:hypothetical protein
VNLPEEVLDGVADEIELGAFLPHSKSEHRILQLLPIPLYQKRFEESREPG